MRASPDGKLDNEGGSTAGSLLDPDKTVVIGYDGAHDGQSQSGSSYFTTPCLVHAVESLKNPGQMLLCYSAPVISNFEDYLPI